MALLFMPLNLILRSHKWPPPSPLLLGFSAAFDILDRCAGYSPLLPPPPTHVLSA